MTYTDLTDVELVRKYQEGKSGAFEALVRRYQNRIFRLAMIWLHDQQQAEDVVQEVFLRSHKGLRSFRHRAHPFTWLYRTTKNTCREFNRKHRGDPLETEPVDRGPGPDEQLGAAEICRRVRALVAALPERQREVVVLRMFEELSVRDTAKTMGCREGTVKALLHKAIARLRVETDA